MMNSSRRILLQSHGSLLRSYARAATNQFNCYSSETARLLEVGLTPAAKTTTKCSLAVTKLAIAKKHQCFFTSSSTNADTGGLHRRFATTRLELDTNESLVIKCEQGRSGKKFFAIIKSMSSKQVFFPNILIPEEAYQYVESIDQLLLALASRDDANVPQPDSQLHILERRNLKGVHFEFEFNVCLRRNNQYAFTAIARVGNVDRMVNRYRMFILPIRALPILRQTMAEMLAEHDGSQLLGPGPELPEWIMQAPPLREQKIPNLAQKRKRRTNQQQQNKEAFNENNQQLDQQNNSNIPHPQQSQQQQFLAQLQSLQQQMIPQQTTASNVAQMANLLNQLKTQAAQIEALTISTTNMLNAAAGQMYGNQQMPTAGQHSPIFGFPPPQLPIFPAFGFGTQQLMQTNNPSQLSAKIGQLQAQLNQQQQKSSTKNPRKNETMARPLGGQQNWANNRLGDLAAKKQRTVTFVPPQQKDQQQMTNAVNQTLVGKKNANEEKVVYDSEKAEQPNAVAEEIRRVLAETEQEITGAEEHAEHEMMKTAAEQTEAVKEETAAEQTENVKEEEKKKSMGASFLKGKMKATG